MKIEARITCRGYLEDEPLEGVDLDALARDIVTERIRREEFFVEIRDAASGASIGSLHAGALFPAESDSLIDRWCVTYAEPDEHGRWCLAQLSPEDRYRWYVFCGGETEVLDSCAVPLSAAVAAVRACSESGTRPQSLGWVDMTEAVRLSQ